MKYCNNPNCTGGKVFDTTTSKFEDCPFCLEIKLAQIDSGVSQEDGTKIGLSEKLGFRRIFTRLLLEPEKVFGKYAYDKMDKEAVAPMIERLTGLMSSLATGRVPKSSLLCYIGSKGDVELLGYLILASAYKSNLVVHPLVTPFVLRGLRQDFEKMKEMIMADVVVATFTPSIKEDVYLMEDMLRERAYQGRPTIFILSDGVGLNSLIQRICSFEDYSYHQTLYMGIPYASSKDSDEKKLGRINKGIANSNAKLNIKTPLLSIEDITKQPKQTGITLGDIPKVSSRDVFGGHYG